MPTKSKRQPKSSIVTPTCGVVTPTWARAREILGGIKHLCRLTIAGRILLGHELHHLKASLGYSGRGGDRRSQVRKKYTGPQTWDDWCKAELDISRSCADRMIETYEAGKARVKKLGGPDKLISLLNTPCDDLTDTQSKQLADLVDRLEWPDSQAELLAELHIAKRHVEPKGGDTSTQREPKGDITARQLAFSFFSSIPVGLGQLSRAVSNIRIAKDYKLLLASLPATEEEPDQPCLTSLAADIAAAKADLETLESDIAAQLNNAKKP